RLAVVICVSIREGFEREIRITMCSYSDKLTSMCVDSICGWLENASHRMLMVSLWKSLSLPEPINEHTWYLRSRTRRRRCADPGWTGRCGDRRRETRAHQAHWNELCRWSSVSSRPVLSRSRRHHTR